MGHGVWVKPWGLLEEDTIRQTFDPPVQHWDGELVVFPVEGGALPFDVFSMAFYLLSRYEEYFDFPADEHQRYPASASIAMKTGNLQRPWLDLVLEKLKAWLLSHFESLVFKKHEFSFLPTIDVDMAYAYRGKPIWRNLLAFSRDVLKGSWKLAGERLLVLSGKKEDPHHTFGLIESLHKREKVRYFFLLADYSTYDKNLPWNHPLMKSLVRHLKKAATIGIHPSYHAMENKNLMVKEIKTLKELTGEDVLHSRQHYLRCTFPQTFQNLADVGILHDYTLGYPEAVGFRASTCKSFPFYNLRLNKQTNLILHPFMVMDVTLNYYLKLTPQQAMLQIKSLLTQVKHVGGNAISLWHNESLSETGNWLEWRQVYEFLISEAHQ